MKTKRKNKLGTYLAVTVGVGCAASVAEGAIVVVDLSGLSTGLGDKSLPGSDGITDFTLVNTSALGYLYRTGSASFYTYQQKPTPSEESFARGYWEPFFNTGGAVFGPGKYAVNYTAWNYNNDSHGFSVGKNWVAFKDTASRFGWMSFTLSSLGVNTTLPISSFGHFVYDDSSTTLDTAMGLQPAIAAVAAVPEPSSLALLALGATGLLARRRRKQAA